MATNQNVELTVYFSAELKAKQEKGNEMKRKDTDWGERLILGCATQEDPDGEEGGGRLIILAVSRDSVFTEGSPPSDRPLFRIFP